MPTFFFDTSGLVKYYIQESGTDWVTHVIDQPNTILVAHVTYAELQAAIAKRYRIGDITAQERDQLAALIWRHFQRRKFLKRALTWNIALTAGQLALTYSEAQLGMRAYDAIQLATALSAHQEMVSSSQTALTFVTADQRLLNIARLVGLPVIDPAPQS